MRTTLIAIIFLLCINPSISQEYTPENTEIELQQLNEVDQISYINDNFYAIYSSDFSNSLKLTKQAIALSKKLNLPNQEALAQKNYGIILYLMGNYEEALPAYLRSYDLFDSLNDKSGIARLSNEMANYYQKQGEYQEALSLWAQSEKLAKEVGDMRALGSSLGMQATYFWIRGNYKKSDPLYRECHQIYLQTNDSVGLGYTFLDMADIEKRKGDYEKAIRFINQSTTIRETIGDHQGVLENLKVLGDFYFGIGELEKATQYYNQVIEESLQFSYPDLARKSMDSLSSLKAKQANYKSALNLKIRAENLEDSLFNLERSKVISELKTRYETEKKEQQITIQNAQLSEQEADIERNQILLGASVLTIVFLILLGLLQRNRLKKKQQLKLRETELKAREAEINATISSQEKERARYARDLHDGFGQMISILNMNLQNLNQGSKPDERQKVFEASEKVINEMYEELKNICFDLMPQTLIKNGLVTALKELTDRINESGKIFIELNTFGLENRLTELQEISLYRISQEWINNMLKYSDADKATLQITKDEEEITLLIEDNGTGFDETLLTSGKGNGWKNLNTRAKLIQGELELETKKGIKGNVLILNALVKTKKELIEAS